MAYIAAARACVWHVPLMHMLVRDVHGSRECTFEAPAFHVPLSLACGARSSIWAWCLQGSTRVDVRHARAKMLYAVMPADISMWGLLRQARGVRIRHAARAYGTRRACVQYGFFASRRADACRVELRFVVWVIGG
eukprot:6186414-Pleurochrysis_carterae.AAC.2